MKKNRTKRQIIEIALNKAIQWEMSFIDSYRNCDGEDDQIVIQRSVDLVADFDRLLNKEYSRE